MYCILVTIVIPSTAGGALAAQFDFNCLLALTYNSSFGPWGLRLHLLSGWLKYNWLSVAKNFIATNYVYSRMIAHHDQLL